MTKADHRKLQALLLKRAGRDIKLNRRDRRVAASILRRRRPR